MSLKDKWMEFCRRWFGSSNSAMMDVIGILSRRYEEERQRALRYRRHAEKMRYPQFRQTLSRIAAQEDEHADMIGKKLTALGVRLPDVLQAPLGSGNNWSLLLQDLEEERHSAELLQDQMRLVGADFSDVLELFSKIGADEDEHRGAIRELLMRSDPQAMNSAA